MTNATPNENITSNDPVNHPSHYVNHPSGIECIQVTEHMGFNLGNATKYIWRCDLKKDAIEDLKKARWYVDREIERREKVAAELAATKFAHPASGNIIGTAYINISPSSDPANTSSIARDVLSAVRTGAHVG